MKNENCTLTYFLTSSLFQGFGISILFLKSGKDTYIGAILGVILGFLIIKIYEYLIAAKQNKNLKEIYKSNKIIGNFLRFIILLLSIVILIYVLVIFKLFVTSFLLVNTPIILILIPFLVLACYSAFLGLKNINDLSNCLFPASIILFIFCCLSLISNFNIDEFLPLLTKSNLSILNSTLTFTGIAVFPNILTLHLSSNIKNYSQNFLLGAVFQVLMIIFVTSIYGEPLALLFRFPEYMVLKQLKLFNFIEKIENILSIFWILSHFITTIMAIYSIKECVPTKKNKAWTIIIISIVTYLITKFLNYDHTLEVKLYYILPILALVSSLIVIPPLYYLIKKTHRQQCNKHH